jgi:hypothetical protein
MYYHKTIRSFIALFLLVVFAFSISSQKVVHDLVAQHSDQVKCEVHKSVPIDQVEKSTIHCTQDNLVVASSFANFSFAIYLTHPVLNHAHNTFLPSFYFYTNSYTLASRGPPNA